MVSKRFPVNAANAYIGNQAIDGLSSSLLVYCNVFEVGDIMFEYTRDIRGCCWYLVPLHELPHLRRLTISVDLMHVEGTVEPKDPMKDELEHADLAKMVAVEFDRLLQVRGLAEFNIEFSKDDEKIMLMLEENHNRVDVFKRGLKRLEAHIKQQVTQPRQVVRTQNHGPRTLTPLYTGSAAFIDHSGVVDSKMTADLGFQDWRRYPTVEFADLRCRA